MNVLYHFRTRGLGAEAVHIGGMAEAFRREGHCVFFCSPAGAAEPSPGRSPFSDAGRGWRRFLPHTLGRLFFELLELGYNVPAWYRLRTQLRARAPGLVYERHAFYLVATALLLRHRTALYVVEVNELVGDERVRSQPVFAALVGRIDRLVFRTAALIVVVSPHLQRRLEALGIPSSKILVLPNAVEPSECVLRDGGRLRAGWGWPGCCVIGFVGWFVAWHRLDGLLRAVATLIPDFPNARLVLAGDGPLRGELQALAQQLGLAEKVLFSGPVEHEAVPELIAAFDIAVIPHSNAYRSPIKLFEYLAQARPVVAPATEPIRQVLEEGRNGLLFEPGNEIVLGAALRRLLNDPAARTTLGEKGRETVLARHTWDHNLKEILRHLSL